MPVTGEFTDPAERVRKLARDLEAPLQVVFFQALNLIQDQMTLTELADLLSAGRVEEALRSVEAAAGLIANVYTDGMLGAASATTAWLSNGILVNPATFDPLDLPVVRAMQQSRLEIIQDFTVAQREAVFEALRDGAVRGLNPRDTARAFRSALGLTPKQVQEVNNYRSLLEDLDRDALRRELRDKRSDRTIIRALERGEGIPADRIDQMVDRYRENQLRFRAERIARTESLAAANQGSYEAYDQLLRTGALDGDEIENTWNTSVDGRERPSHLNLNGQTKRHGEVFVGFNGNLRYPHDPQAPASERVHCRCALERRLRPAV